MSAGPPTMMTRIQQGTLVVLRFAIGWHLFLQGYGKLTQPGWSAASYLQHATGPLAGIFRALAAKATMLSICDISVPWTLLVAGLFLMLGLATRSAGVAAMLLLAAFVLAHPPLLVGGILVVGPDGNAELYVNQTVIEILALAVVLVFDTGRLAGLDLLLRGRRPAPMSSSTGQQE
jgi:uncharacterized membrane protein YphA (DoxX/SURF4 family)